MNEPSRNESFDPATIRNTRLQLFFQYWNTKRGAAPCPRHSDIDPLEIRYALGYVLIAERRPPPDHFHFRLMGQELVERYGVDLTGRSLAAYPEPIYRELVRKTFSSVIDQRRPVLVDRNIVTAGRRHRYEGLTLPLSSDGTTIDQVIACLDFSDE
jgi:hypothetical protein